MSEPCPICQTVEPLMESHHIHPIHLGGDPNGPQVMLCNDCHDKIHAAARCLMAKTPEARKKLYKFLKPAEFERAKDYVFAIVAATKEHKSKPSTALTPRRRMITLYGLNDVDWARLHKKKSDAGFTDLSKYLEAVIKQLIGTL